MRNEKGQFIKGVSASPDTQFKKGQHWRERKSFWDKDWLYNEYVVKKRSSGDIAKDFAVTDASILFWLNKHGIKKRDVSQARECKIWGSSGSDNPMWNRKGELNPRWKGGVTPERQSFYVGQEWKDACSRVWKRDGATCQRCALQKKDSPDVPFHIHHIVSFSDKDLRAEPSNLLLVCEPCHLWIHSKKNKNNEYIQEI